MASQNTAESLKSTLLPELDYNLIQHAMEWVALALLTTIISISISFFFLFLTTERIARDRHARDAVAKVKRFLPMLKAFIARHNNLASKMAEINTEIFQMTRAHERATHSLAQIKKRKYIRVRFANTPNRSLVCYSGYVYNEHVRKYVAKEQHYPLLDDEWAVPQLVEVWSDSVEGAEQEIYKKYLKSQGFIINNLEKVRRLPTKEQILNEPASQFNGANTETNRTPADTTRSTPVQTLSNQIAAAAP